MTKALTDAQARIYRDLRSRGYLCPEVGAITLNPMEVYPQRSKQGTADRRTLESLGEMDPGRGEVRLNATALRTAHEAWYQKRGWKQDR
jgi:hypothetical protein